MRTRLRPLATCTHEWRSIGGDLNWEAHSCGHCGYERIVEYQPAGPPDISYEYVGADEEDS